VNWGTIPPGNWGRSTYRRSALCLALFYPRAYTSDRDHGHRRRCDMPDANVEGMEAFPDQFSKEPVI